MGYFSRYTKQSAFGDGTIPTQKAGQSLTELGSASTAMKFNPKTSMFELGIDAGETKRIVDFWKVGKRISLSTTRLSGSLLQEAVMKV
jgi:hypothetical protein